MRSAWRGLGGRRSCPRAQVALGSASAQGARGKHPRTLAAGAEPRACRRTQAAERRFALARRDRRLAGDQRLPNATAVEHARRVRPSRRHRRYLRPDSFQPVRIELFGDEIESIRPFRVETQRSHKRLDAIDVTAVVGTAKRNRKPPPPGRRGRQGASCRLSSSAKLVPARRTRRPRTRGTAISGRLAQPQGFHTVDNVFAARQHSLRSLRRPSRPARWKRPAICGSNRSSVSAGDIAKVRDELDAAGRGQEVFIVCQTEAEIERLQQSSARRGWPRRRPLAFSPRPSAGRLPPRAAADRAGQRRRAVPSRRPARPARAAASGPRDRQLSRAARGRSMSSTCRTASAAIAD